MSPEPRHGRRRAVAPRVVVRGAAQRAGIALGAAGLVLALCVPAGEVAAPIESGIAEPVQARVSAAPDAAVSFPRSEVHSVPAPDERLQHALEVTAAKVTAAVAKGTLAAPLDVLEPTSAFGARLNPLTGEQGEEHTGQDFAIGCGTAVSASAGGTVTFAGWHPYGGGNRVVIDHGHGLSTTYNHLSGIGVRAGQVVDRGVNIARSGTTGASTGCHLHFEVLVGGEPTDPLGWL